MYKQVNNLSDLVKYAIDFSVENPFYKLIAGINPTLTDYLDELKRIRMHIRFVSEEETDALSKAELTKINEQLSSVGISSTDELYAIIDDIEQDINYIRTQMQDKMSDLVNSIIEKYKPLVEPILNLGIIQNIIKWNPDDAEPI